MLAVLLKVPCATSPGLVMAHEPLEGKKQRQGALGSTLCYENACASSFPSLAGPCTHTFAFAIPLLLLNLLNQHAISEGSVELCATLQACM